MKSRGRRRRKERGAKVRHRVEERTIKKKTRMRKYETVDTVRSSFGVSFRLTAAAVFGF